MLLTKAERGACAGDYYESLRLEQEARSEELHAEALEQLESFLLLEYAEPDCLDFIEDEPDCHLFFSLSECREIFSDIVARRAHESIVNKLAIGRCQPSTLSFLEVRFLHYLSNYDGFGNFLTTQVCKDILSEMATKYDIEAIYEFLTERRRSSRLSLLDFLFIEHLDNCDFFSDYRNWLNQQV